MKFSFNRSINIYFWIITSLLLFACLGSREIWTQEWRWGEIVRVMQLHHDYFHPVLAGKIYFDKPLLSYWLMSLATTITSSLSTLAIRLPSAIAGLLSIFFVYTIAKNWFNKSTGQIAAIILSTTYYFIFWARTASTDMLNVAGILCAVAWYFSKRDQLNFFNYTIFFAILALTALLKGLIGPILAILIIAPDIFSRFKDHIRWSFLFSIFPAILLYILPFYLTSLINHSSLFASGLDAVYRENVLRFFDPFDHKGSFYTYFIYLPVYLLPWSFFFFYALYQWIKKWKLLDNAMQQLIMSNILVFVFLTLSGSRRSYYILPLVPLAILVIARWVSGDIPAGLRDAKLGAEVTKNLKVDVKSDASVRVLKSDGYSTTSNTLTPGASNTSGRGEIKLFNITAIFSSISLLTWFVFFQPLYYSHGGLPVFSQQLQHYMQTDPQKKWRIGFLNADNRLSFYLPGYDIDFSKGDNLEQYDILITQEKELSRLKVKTILVTKPHLGNRLLPNVVEDAPIAVVPLRLSS